MLHGGIYTRDLSERLLSNIFNNSTILHDSHGWWKSKRMLTLYIRNFDCRKSWTDDNARFPSAWSVVSRTKMTSTKCSTWKWRTWHFMTISVCNQWRRLHRARGHVPPPNFYKWLGMGTSVSSRTPNKKLVKLYWPLRERSPNRLIVLLEPKEWRGTTSARSRSRRTF